MSANETETLSEHEGSRVNALQRGGSAAAARVNLHYPVQSLGSRRERMGQREHATYGILLESYLQNTGDFLVDEKGDGQ